jgi:hypothetical protein
MLFTETYFKANDGWTVTPLPSHDDYVGGSS